MRCRALAERLLVASLLGALAPAAQAAVSGLIIDPRVAEISGMATSHARAGRIWVHNDSDHAAQLYALDRNGSVRGTLSLRGVRNVDWEDMASFELDGRPWLLVADTGDNGGLRDVLTLYVVEEPPKLAARGEVAPAWRVRFRWPDGPRDCEAVAVDAAAGQVLLVSKKRVPAQLFTVPLRPPSESGVVVAQQIGSLAGIPAPTADEMKREPRMGRYGAQVTAMDLSPDGRRLAVLAYRDVYLYTRGAGESWASATARPPRALRMPRLPQSEAVSFARDGTRLWITTERLPAPLLSIPLPQD